MFKIHISYRREDEQSNVAGLIRDELDRQFGKNHVFLDLAEIPSGTSFRDELGKKILTSDFVFVLINKKWVETTRLRKNTSDFARQEIEFALLEKIPLVPLLIDDVPLPAKSDLPESISRLVEFQAFRVNPQPDRIGHDIGEILSYLENRYNDKVVTKSEEKQGYAQKFAKRPFKTMHTKHPLHVFLCHSSGDKPKVRQLYHRLLNEGVNPWLDEENLLPGQDWQIEIPKAVKNSDVVIVCLSKESITKAGYVQKEIKHALDIADEQPEGTIFIIPTKLEECDVPERLKRWQWVNLFDDNGYQRLVQSLNMRALAKNKS